MTERTPSSASAQGKVFLSYAREDRDFAQTLSREIESAGETVWLDDRIQPGERWDHAVHEQLTACKRLVVILSPHAVASENVLDEVGYALDNGKDVTPVLYRDCEIPLRLRRIQYIDRRGVAVPPSVAAERFSRNERPPGLTTNLKAAAAIGAWTLAITITATIYFGAVGMRLGPQEIVVVTAMALALSGGWHLWRRGKRIG